MEPRLQPSPNDMRPSAFVPVCLATALLTCGCGRSGLSVQPALETNDQPAGAGTLRRSFRLPNLPAKWAAYQDGAGPWVRIQPIVKGGDEYQFVVRDPSGQIGFVVAADIGGGHTEIFVTFLTLDDCLDGVELDTSGPSKPTSSWHGILSWSVTGLADGERATVSIAGRANDAYPGSAGYSMVADWPSAGDVLVMAGPENQLPTRTIVRRGLHFGPGTTLSHINLASAEAVPLQASELVLDMPANVSQADGWIFMTTPGHSRAQVSRHFGSGTTTVPFMSLPASLQAPGDLYETFCDYSTATGGARVTSYFHSPAGQKVVMPAAPSGGRVSNAGGPGHVRPTAEWPSTVAEPGSMRIADFTQGPDMVSLKWWHVTVSSAYATADSGPMTIPDLREVDGWDPVWDLPAGNATDWRVGTLSALPGGPKDGATQIFSFESGSLAP